MLNLFTTDYKRSHLDIWLLVLRVTIAVFMLTHGYAKFEKLFGPDEIAFSDPLGVTKPISLGLAVFGEFFCSILLAFGLFTRFAAFALFFTMFVAAFLAQAGATFGKRELALLYMLVYITFVVVGPGRYSLDALISRKRAPRGG